MKLLCLRLLFALGLCLTFGCGERAPDPPAGGGESRSTFAERLNAAMSIVDLSKRDDAMVVVANAAAAAGEADVTRQALGRTVDISKRDTAAESCALSLAKAGKRAEAAVVARQILDVSRRDRTLSKLATE